MIRCEHCGSELPNGALFCGECGRAVTVAAVRRAPEPQRRDAPTPPPLQPPTTGRPAADDPAAAAWLPESTLDPATRAWLTGEQRAGRRGADAIPVETPDTAPDPRGFAPRSAPTHVHGSGSGLGDWSPVAPDGHTAGDEEAIDPEKTRLAAQRPASAERPLPPVPPAPPAPTEWRPTMPDAQPGADAPVWEQPPAAPPTRPAAPSWWIDRPTAAAADTEVEPPVRSDAPDAVADAPSTDVPSDGPAAEAPNTDTPSTDTPGTDTPGLDTPGTGTSGTGTSGTDTPGTGTSGTDTSGTDPQGADALSADIPNAPAPGTSGPGAAAADAPTVDAPRPGDTAVVPGLPTRRASRPAPLVAPGTGTVTCHVCGHELQPDDIFCPECSAVRPAVTAAFTGPIVPLPVERPDWSRTGEVDVVADTPSEADGANAGAASVEAAPAAPAERATPTDPAPPVPPVEPVLPQPPASATVPSSAPRSGLDRAKPLAPTLPPVPGSTEPPAAADANADAVEGDDGDEDTEATRIVGQNPTRVPFVLHFSTGERVDVHGTGLLGRFPRPLPTERFDALVTIVDPGKSVSKTHLEFGREGTDLWVSDRNSGNGTVVRHIDGSIRECEPGRRYRVERGARVDIGEQFFLVQ